MALIGLFLIFPLLQMLYCTVDVSAGLPRPSRQSLISLGETEPHIPQDLVAEVRFCLESKIIIYNCSMFIQYHTLCERVAPRVADLLDLYNLKHHLKQGNRS